MRFSSLAVTSLLFAGLIGCSETSERACERDCPHLRSDAPVEVLPPPVMHAGYSPALLFDRVPARYSATDFAYRSDWPSTGAYYSLGEVINYREYSYDYQSPSRGAANASYRLFETRRAGGGYR